MEVWKNIPDYEGLYQISDTGRVRSLPRTIIDKNGREIKLSERIMRTHVNNAGYKKVRLVNSAGVSKGHFVHRLVLLSFVGRSENIANHKDGKKLNNTLDNLEYSTYSKNLKHAYDIGLRRSAIRIHGKEIIELYKAGKPASYIAKKFKTIPAVVKSHLENNGIEIRGPMEAQRKYQIDFEKMVKLIKSEVPNKEIALYFNVPRHTIDQYKSQIKRGRTKF